MPTEENDQKLLARLEKFYHAAKKRAWSIDDLPWDSAILIPGFETERWHLLWSSVIQQQLQADLFAVKGATYLLAEAPTATAKMYYCTMTSDEARHVEGWTRLAGSLNFVEGQSPYFTELAQMFWEADTLEEQVLVFQVCYEGCAIDAFKEIAKSAQDTVLGAMAKKLVGDDIIHHHSGIAYSNYLLSQTSPSFRKHLGQAMKKYAPVYIENLNWRPPVRKWLSKFMVSRDEVIVKRNRLQINTAIASLGLAVPFDL
jgi:hypothetical protein